MVKKMKSSSDSGKSSGAAGLLDSQLASSVKESAQQIWLAGMGAFAKAQQEGSKVFEALVKEGQSLQKKTQSVAEDKFGEVSGKMSSMAETVTAKAGQNWDKLEAIFEARTAKAMGKLGVPSSKDVDALNKRVEELSAQMAGMSRSRTSARKAAPAAKAGRTTRAAKSAPAKRGTRKAAA